MWTTGSHDETPEESAAWRREMRLRRRVPGNEVGGAVLAGPLLCRSPEIGIHLDAVKVFSTGLQLRFEVLTRPSPSLGLGHSQPMPPWMDSAGEGGMLVGVKLADGRAAINIDDDRRSSPSGDDELVLARSGFIGSGDAASVQYLLSPMPIMQTLTVVVAWPKYGVPETAAIIDGAEIVAGTGRLVTLWPAEDNLDWFRPALPPDLPLGR